MYTVFFDTETTGLPKKGKYQAPVSDPDWPHTVELGFIVDDQDRNTKARASIIIDAGCDVPPEATRIHGITTEISQGIGVPPIVGAALFSHVLKKTRVRVAHNLDFDWRILGALFFRLGRELKAPTDQLAFCTKELSTPVCKLPGTVGYKWPTLDEAYRILVNPQGFTGAHGALADTAACREVYYKLLDAGHIH